MKKVLLVLVFLVAGLAAVVATRPDTYHVERSLDIDAPPETIFPSVADLRNMGEWSPWEKRDPAMKKTFSESTTGIGASYAWEGNKQVGKGKMTITQLLPPQHVGDKLEFLEPFPAVAETAMDLRPGAAGGTRVTWSMDGKSNFVGKAFSLVMSMDKAIGKDFEDGLANLKRVAETKKGATASAAGQAPAPGAAAAPSAPAKP
jgi:hypothetical protein